MLIKLKGSALLGIDAILITIEINVSMGQGYSIVGLPDNSIKESLDRTESALKANGFHMPRTKILVNLSPADLKKTGAAFDLPIAIGLIAASEQLNAFLPLDKLLIMGELGLDGLLYPIHGALAMAMKAKSAGLSALLLPIENVAEAALIEGLPIYGFSQLKEVVSFLTTGVHINTYEEVKDHAPLLQKKEQPLPKLEDIKGQSHCKRALEIASAGGHNLIMIGPPGAGKTMLAKSIVSILPPLNKKEAIDTTQVYSICNKTSISQSLRFSRPFRQPHHTISNIAMIGGGSHPQPGEISLAHNGVLFLDELPEFKRNVIEVLRQPMEEGIVHIARAKMNVIFPASFILIASMNPCPCGFYNHPLKDCSCSASSIQKYIHKISGPLLDRIDLHIEVAPLNYNSLTSSCTEISSQEIACNVLNARKIQSHRFKEDHLGHTNAQMNRVQQNKYCYIEPAGAKLLQNAMEKFQLSVRSYDRIIKVARTIADLDNSESILPKHLSEAIQYRCLDRSSWGRLKE
jgi:magnesium chelatase family protein